MQRFTLGDALRGIAAIGVVVLHTHWFIPFYSLNAYWPDFFFVLSGLVLAKYYDSTKTESSWRKFAAKRLVRFYPLVFASVALLLLLAVVQSRVGTNDGWPGELQPLNIITALALLQLFYFPANFVATPLWSLSAELFINLTSYWPARRFKTAFLIAAIVGGVAIQAWIVPTYSPGKTFFFITGLMSLSRVTIGFCLGLLIAAYPVKRFSWIGAGFSTTAVVLFFAIHDEGFHVTAAPFVCALALRYILLLEPKFAKTRLTKVAEFLGTSSFGIYVWHPAFRPISYSIADRIGTATGLPDGPIQFFVLMTLTLIVTRLGYRFIELPTMRWVNARTKIAAVSD